MVNALFSAAKIRQIFFRVVDKIFQNKVLHLSFSSKMHIKRQKIPMKRGKIKESGSTLGSPQEGIENAACGDGNPRLRRWSSPRAAIGNSAGGV
ncbi:MAG: hypothetical protein IJK51_10315 [Bacteroidaceae bacterium]|nr:hypothetical protein [Bacteroidaceae bacterium]